MIKTYYILLILSFNTFLLSQEVTDVSISSCESDAYPDFTTNRIIEKRLESDTLILSLDMVFNCCITPYFEVLYQKDTLYLQISNESDIVCMCDCCFAIDMKVTDVPDTNFVLMYKYNKREKGFLRRMHGFTEVKVNLKKYPFPSLETIEKYESFEAKNDTTVDGQKIGFWVNMYKDTNLISSKALYELNSEGNSYVVWYLMYNTHGNIIEICARNELNDFKCATRREYEQIMNVTLNNH